MEKMREEFEAWCASIGFTLKPNAFSNGDYAMGYGWEEWNAWKASRAALRVELPQPEPGDGAMVWSVDVEVALDNAGVSYK